MIFKNILLRVQANFEPPAKRAALTKEADELQAKALEIRKQQQGTATTTAKKPGEK